MPFMDAVLTAGGALALWLLGAAWTSLRDLQKADKELAEKVSSIEVLVAGKYITREEFRETITEVFSKLDRIQHTLINNS